jgi:hypothetical protein
MVGLGFTTGTLALIIIQRAWNDNTSIVSNMTKGNGNTISDLYQQCIHRGDVEQSGFCRAAVLGYLQCSRSGK